MWRTNGVQARTHQETTKYIWNGIGKGKYTSGMVGKGKYKVDFQVWVGEVVK